jgi:hypothetical protein
VLLTARATERLDATSLHPAREAVAFEGSNERLHPKACQLTDG